MPALNQCEFPAPWGWEVSRKCNRRTSTTPADGAILRGYLAFEEGAHARPGVLVFHEGLRLGDFAMEKARQLAAIGFCFDGSMMRTALYHEQSDRRSWAAMRAFLDETL